VERAEVRPGAQEASAAAPRRSQLEPPAVRAEPEAAALGQVDAAVEQRVGAALEVELPAWAARVLLLEALQLRAPLASFLREARSAARDALPALRARPAAW
jgi:hypothetical protein